MIMDFLAFLPDILLATDLTLAIDPITAGLAGASILGGLFGGGGGDEREQAARQRKEAAGLGRERVARDRRRTAETAPVRQAFLTRALGFGDPTNPFSQAPGQGEVSSILQQMASIGSEPALQPQQQPSLEEQFGPFASRFLPDEAIQKDRQERARNARINELLGFGFGAV